MGDTTIRSSSLTSYFDCPRRWAARYLRDEIESYGYDLKETRNNIAASIGTGVHSGAAYLLRKKISRELDNDFLDAAIGSFRIIIEEGEVTTDDISPTIDCAEKQIVRMTKSYKTDILPIITPLLVEERFAARATQNLILSGQGDSLCHGQDGLRDLKTGSTLKSHRPQVGSYSLLYRSQGYNISAVWIDFIQRVPLKKLQPPAQSIPLNVGDCEMAAQHTIDCIDRDISVFGNGCEQRKMPPGEPWAFPANPMSVLCSERYCPAHGTAWCTEHK